MNLRRCRPGSWRRLAALAAPAAAQRNQPIYPAYDGYLKNPDGSYTLSFAYFSHNAEPVTIPPGAHNTFAPAPGRPRSSRPPSSRATGAFSASWWSAPSSTASCGGRSPMRGTTTGTSQNMLQSNWNLVEGAAELRQIDYAKVPKGVCLNRAPQVRVLGASGGGRGKPATLR